ncbi:MAG: sigma-70 family RNA polymerase sigma factor [Oscillospiraceae bacterium]|nr:sigma-70 family RNA polymerase sigma factor [Oscillospiraceae bacterium]
MNEQEIIELILAKDDRGMDALLRHYGPLMRYIISPILSNAEDREECLSEAAMRVWEKITQYDDTRGSFHAWLTAIARNTALNRQRRTTSVDSEIPESTPAPEPTPEEQVLREERQNAVKRALGQLSQTERNLFYRKYYYLQSTAQIASELGMTERAVEGKLYRLKKRIRKMLGGEGYD